MNGAAKPKAPTSASTRFIVRNGFFAGLGGVPFLVIPIGCPTAAAVIALSKVPRDETSMLVAGMSSLVAIGGVVGGGLLWALSTAEWSGSVWGRNSR